MSFVGEGGRKGTRVFPCEIKEGGLWSETSFCCKKNKTEKSNGLLQKNDLFLNSAIHVTIVGAQRYYWEVHCTPKKRGGWWLVKKYVVGFHMARCGPLVHWWDSVYTNGILITVEKQIFNEFKDFFEKLLNRLLHNNASEEIKNHSKTGNWGICSKRDQLSSWWS